MFSFERELEKLNEEFLNSNRNIFDYSLNIQKKNLNNLNVTFSSSTFNIFFSIDCNFTKEKLNFTPNFDFLEIFDNVSEFCETEKATLVGVVSLVFFLIFLKADYKFVE
jgi:hypothetical protein